MDIIIQQAISAVFTGSIAAALVGVIFHRRTRSIEQQLRIQAETQIDASRSTREWQERALSEILGPAAMHLERTRRAFDRWKDKQLFLEMEIIGKSNGFIRDILLQNGHLLPADLLGHASALIEHYDAWLEEFDKKRLSETPDLDAKFIFVAPLGYGFPHEAERAFNAKFQQMRKQLYGAV